MDPAGTVIGAVFPSAHFSPSTCKKSHVSSGSCSPSGVGAWVLPPAVALRACTQSCSRGPTDPKNSLKVGSCLQAQQGELRWVPGATHPLGTATSHASLVGPGKSKTLLLNARSHIGADLLKT